MSGYDNPFRAILNLNPERIDQGVDYSGTGPVYALGNAVIENITAGGWPGGVFIQYKMLDGPAQGLHVYVAEDITPTVSVGQTVSSSTVIGNMYAGSSGIETGWANPNPSLQRALGFGDWREGGGSTAAGVDFNKLLVSLGAPSGIVHNPIQGTYSSQAATDAAGATLDSSSSSSSGSNPCVISAPSISGPFGLGSVGGGCLLSASQGRALLGGAAMFAGGLLVVVGLALMAASSRASRRVLEALPLIAAAA